MTRDKPRKSNYKISICIPAYNQPDSLKRCLDSILQQTLLPDEIIVSDDSPSDIVLKIVKKYSRMRMIRYFHNHPSKGTPANWNAALKKARGDYLMLMCHDDWFYNETALENMAWCAINRSADFVFARSFGISSEGKIQKENNPKDSAIRKLNSDSRSLFYNNLIGAPSTVLFRNKRMFFSPELKWLVDIEFYIRYLGKRSPLYVPKALVGVGIGPSQVSNSCFNNPEVELKENIIVYEKLDQSLKFFFNDCYHFLRLFNRLDLSENFLCRFHPPSKIAFFFKIYKIFRPALKLFKFQKRSE